MPEDNDLPKVIESLGHAFEEFKSANESNLKKRDGLTEAKLDKLNTELDRLSSLKTELEAVAKQQDEIEKKLNRQKLGGSNDEQMERNAKAFNAMRLSRGHTDMLDPAQVAGYRTVFGKYMRKGDSHAPWTDAERLAMSVGSDPDGGYVVDPDTNGRIVTRVFDTSPIRQVANVQTIGTDALEGMKDTDEVGTGGWVGETAARNTSTTAQVGIYRIPVNEVYAMPEATQKFLDDANVDVEGWLANKVGDKFARVENTAFVVGNGVGQPFGFTQYPTAATADTSRAWGTFEHVATGVAGDFAASAAGDVLFDLISRFKPFYLNNARWIGPRAVFAKIRKFKGATTGDYLWQPGLQNGQPDRLLGYPILPAEDMPALASGSLSLALGDLGIAYQIVDRAGIRTLRDPLTNKPFVRFYSTKRVGGAAIQFESLKFVKFS